MSKKNFLVSVGLLAVLLGLFGLGIYSFFNALAPVQLQKGEKVIVQIRPGMSTKGIAHRLEKEGVIRSSEAFQLLARYTGKAKKLQAGEYELDNSHTSWEILQDLIEGKVKLRRITVPEGYSMYEIAGVLENADMVDTASFISAASDPVLLEEKGIQGETAEGYLFPETYNFPSEITAREIVATMVDMFITKVSPLHERYQGDEKLSFHDIVTLASIIEKETGDLDEYRLVAAVYRNRLARGMLLQADPTVIYGIKDFDGNITRRDLKTDTPYNTYTRRGLPPGPIASPGLKAIEAAYNPADVTYLYFVAKEAGGKHHFSNTLQEHNRAVRKYQLGR